MFLTEQELVALTGRSRRAAQVRALYFMGIEHKVRPDGTVAVLRAHVDKVMGGEVYDYQQKTTEPNWSAI